MPRTPKVDPAVSKVGEYIAEHGPDVSMVDLRGYLRSAGHKPHPNTLAALLRHLGYRHAGYRPIETCPGRSMFYVRSHD